VSECKHPIINARSQGKVKKFFKKLSASVISDVTEYDNYAGD
jgi:hypothetical protein